VFNLHIHTSFSVTSFHMGMYHPLQLIWATASRFSSVGHC